MKRLVCWIIGHKEKIYEAVADPVVLVVDDESKAYPPVITMCGIECARCGANLTPELTRIMYHTIAPLDIEL
jgi:hypothetical protein